MWSGVSGEQFAENSDEQGKSPEQSNPLAEESSMLLAQAGPSRRGRPEPAQQQPKPIGVATMNSDGTIILNLHHHGTVDADAEITYTRADKQYREISDHLGGLRQGEVKAVMPWSDQIQRQDITTPTPTPNDAPAPVPSVAPSADFTNKVNDTYNALPQNVRDSLAKDGVKVVPTDKVTDVMPELKGQKPRGWPPGSSWDDVDGAYDTTGKRIIVAQRQNSSKPYTNDVAGLTRHETGHAVDRLNNLSSQTNFTSAYTREAGNVPAPDKQALDYFLQSGDAGREETFAETFAVINGGATSTYREFLLKKDFPDTIKVVTDQTSKL
jgi:hypothetical protein